MSTESDLRDWRYGQTEAERLVASVLRIEGYVDVEPQQPLGGPDGKKDIVCERRGVKFLAAVHFPGTTTTFAKIKAKFKKDYPGVSKNDAAGFVFAVNKSLSVTEKATLKGLAEPGHEVHIFDLERLRLILDSPDGCGFRLQHLRIAMTEAEQWAFWNAKNQDILQAIHDSEARLLNKLASIDQAVSGVSMSTRWIHADLQKALLHVEAGAAPKPVVESPASTKVDRDILRWMHRIILEGTDVPPSSLGWFRTIDVWIGQPGSTPESAAFVPPSPALIPALLDAWLEAWRSDYDSLKTCSREQLVTALAEYHHKFLYIHPFLDGNGRLARNLLDQASRELLGAAISPKLTTERQSYLAALQAANQGDLEPLKLRIAAAAE